MAGHVRKLESGRWQARFPRGGRGRFRTKSFERKVDAEKWLRDQSHRRDRGEWLDPRAAEELFESVAEGWLASRRSKAPTTRARDASVMKNLVLPHLGQLELREIEPETVEAWIAHLDEVEDKAPATVAKAYHLAAGVLDRAVEHKRILSNPARLPSVRAALPKVERKDMRIIDLDEIGQLADAMPERFRALVLLAGHTGLRWGEAVGLKAKYVNLEERTVTVAGTLTEVDGRVSWQSKAKTKGSMRTVAISNMVADVLRQHLATYPVVGDGYVFTAPEGGPLRRTAFRSRYWRPAVKASVGLPLSFHDLRHSHASVLAAEGFHPKVVADRLGHKSVMVTLDIYSHLFPGMDRAVADRLDELHDGSVKHERSTEKSAKVREIGT